MPARLRGMYAFICLVAHFREVSHGGRKENGIPRQSQVRRKLNICKEITISKIGINFSFQIKFIIGFILFIPFCQKLK